MYRILSKKNHWSMSSKCFLIYAWSVLSLDINECALNITEHGCSHTCIDLLGSYACECPHGYILNNGHDCIGRLKTHFNPLFVYIGQMVCRYYFASHCRAFGHAALSSCYYCRLDIDECAPGASNECDEHAHCVNQPGSYQCHCLAGYDGSGVVCHGMFIVNL